MRDNNFTVSTIFMVYGLGIGDENRKKLGFINAYAKDIDRDIQHKNAVYLLFKPPNMDEFREFLDNELEKNEKIIEDYDYEGGYVVLVYQLDPKFKEDFDLIRQGKYSKTSKEFQDSIPKVKKIIDDRGFHKDQISLQHLIFTKSPLVKEYWEDIIGSNIGNEMEFWTGWDEERETLNIKKII